jgi:cytochrome c-type biogenesis protein CcmH/NrfF
MLCGMNGWLLWGLILPVLLVVAGIVQFQRNKRR